MFGFKRKPKPEDLFDVTWELISSIQNDCVDSGLKFSENLSHKFIIYYKAPIKFGGRWAACISGELSFANGFSGNQERATIYAELDNYAHSFSHADGKFTQEEFRTTLGPLMFMTITNICNEAATSPRPL